jgi:hypothetical protein
MSFFDKLKALFSSVENFLLPFIHQFLSSEGPIILAAAEKAVLALAAQAMPGAEKQSEAFKMIVTDLQSQSITAGTAVINSAIEAAVAKIKATPAT